MPKTVLIADESITIRSVAESLLRGEAYSVRSAADGEMAVELATAERPDLILIGEKLPGISGSDVCGQIKSNPELSSVPIIFMRTDRPGEQPANVDAVLTKPFSPQTLLDAVRRFMGGGPSTDGTGAQVVAVEDTGLADEMIDKALGLEDAITGTETEPSSRIPVQENPEMPSVEPFGTIPQDEDEAPKTSPTPQMEKHEINSLDDDFEVQTSMPESSASSSGGSFMDPEHDEIDRALDEAFGGDLQEPVAKPAPAPGPEPIPSRPSSLEEVSLGDLEAPAAPHAPAGGPDRGTTAPASADDTEEAHDYEWFISEMGKEAGVTPPTASAGDDKPRIEPVKPQAKASKPAASPAGKDGGTKSSEFDIDVEEFEASKRGYDEFISEFRKEIARLEGTVAPPEGDDRSEPVTRGDVEFKDSQGGVTLNADLKALGDRLIEVVAQNVARELAANVDPKRIYAIIEAKLSEVGKPQS